MKIKGFSRLCWRTADDRCGLRGTKAAMGQIRVKPESARIDRGKVADQGTGSFGGKFVLIDFWATWLPAVPQGHSRTERLSKEIWR